MENHISEGRAAYQSRQYIRLKVKPTTHIKPRCMKIIALRQQLARSCLIESLHIVSSFPIHYQNYLDRADLSTQLTPVLAAIIEIACLQQHESRNAAITINANKQKMQPASQQRSLPEQWCTIFFGIYSRNEPVVKSIKEIMNSLTDWKTTRADERYVERVLRGFFKLIRIRQLGAGFEVQFIEPTGQQFDYKFHRATSTTNPKPMFELLGYSEIASADIQEEVMYNERFQCSVHFHKGNDSSVGLHKQYPGESGVTKQNVNILEIRETGFCKIEREKRLSTILKQRFIEEKLVDTFRQLGQEERNQRLRPFIQDIPKSLFSR